MTTATPWLVDGLESAGRPGQDRVQRTGWQRIGEVSGDGDTAWLGRMFAVAMAASVVDDEPAVTFEPPTTFTPFPNAASQRCSRPTKALTEGTRVPERRGTGPRRSPVSSPFVAAAASVPCW